jgi:hypothetical protein
MPTLIPFDDDPSMGAASAAPNLIPVDHNPFTVSAPPPTFIPVDHNPFADNPAAAPKLIPVDYDPFAGTGGTPPKLIPVDHDPFADTVVPSPRFIPVDHDPFAGEAPVPPKLIRLDHPFANNGVAGPKLIPVDHDPFKDAPGTAPKLVPVDYDPFATPGSAGAATVPRISEPMVGGPSAINSTAARPQISTLSNSPSIGTLPASFWLRRAFFVWENQGVWVAATECVGDDPPVWITEHCSHGETKQIWRKLERPLSHFLVSFVLQEVMFGSELLAVAPGALETFDNAGLGVEPVWMRGENAWDIDLPSYYLVGERFLVRRAPDEANGDDWYGCKDSAGAEVLRSLGLPTQIE